MSALEWLYRRAKHLKLCAARKHPQMTERCNCGLEDARKELEATMLDSANQ